MPLRAFRHPQVARAVTLAIALVACGGGDSGAHVEGSASPQSASGTTAANAEFSAADLDAYQRGLAREIELVQMARAAADTATTPESRGAAMQAQFDTETIPEGAKASGLGDRYAPIRRSVHDVLRTLDMQGKIDGPVSIDTASASPETKARLATDPIAELPAASADALRARLDALAAQWGEYVRLTAVGG
ncbi:MAG: hypothetical protein ACYC1S_10330 [Gemmatimonadaceae bacterium]